MDGKIKSHNPATGTGMITPQKPGRDVLFLDAVVEGSGELYVGRPVEYELYEGRDEPEAKRVVLR